jgi:biotin operon repressor
MNPQKQFVSVSLEVLQEYNLSFFEAGILERVRYFSEYDESGSGWCYVSKERLAKEFNVSRQSIIAVVDRLVKKGLFTKNQKGWIKINKGVKKLDCKETLHVKKLDTTCKETLHNIILDKDIHTNDIISSIDSNSVVSKNLTGKETRHVKKPDSKHWKKMNRQEYHEYQLGLGRKPRGDAGIVYISDENMDKLNQRYSEVYVKHAIAILGSQKEKKGHAEYGCDYSVFHKPWLHGETIKMLKIHNIDYETARFKELQARRQAEQEAKEQEIKEKRKTHPELFENE